MTADRAAASQCKLGAVKSVFRLLSHENVDVSISVIKLLSELTDPDTLDEDEEAATRLVSEMVAQQGLPLLVDNLRRFDESSEDDARGVYHTLSVFENLTEVQVRPRAPRARVATLVCRRCSPGTHASAAFHFQGTVRGHQAAAVLASTRGRQGVRREQAVQQ